MQKILLIGDIHLGESRNSTTHPAIIRQANTQAESTLQTLIPHFNSLNLDLVVHMGDALRDTYDKPTDTRNLGRTIELLSQIKAPTIHLLGNHELRAFSHQEVTDIYRQVDSSPTFQGSHELEELSVAWLDLSLDENGAAILPRQQIEHLKQISKKTIVVFSHYSLVPISPSGSFYFETQPDGMYYKNYQQILDALQNSSAKLFINAHVHLLTHQVTQNKHFISNPAFSENIAAQKCTENNPGVYSILEVDNHSFCFTSYSGDFCFGKIEGSLN